MLSLCKYKKKKNTCDVFCFHYSVVTQCQLQFQELVEYSMFASVCVCAHTHVESGSLSLLPRPGILKAFVRLFFPPSGAKAVMYSSKPTRAADNRQFDNKNKHSENRHKYTYLLESVVFCHYELFCLHNTVLSVGVFISVLLCKLLKLRVYAFISLLFKTSQKPHPGLAELYLACLCPCPSALQISGWGYRCRCFPHSAWIPRGPAAEHKNDYFAPLKKHVI